MQYIKVTAEIIPFSTDKAEILMAFLAEMGFESFIETNTGIEAFIQAKDFDEASLNHLSIPMEDTQLLFQHEVMADKNWNEEWEKNYFQPIVVKNMCVVRSPFHAPKPNIPLEIVIEPKMSFGTGHHETTSMMMETLLELPIENKSVLDMGCGTGILGILAAMRGATEVTGIDIDEWCTKNSEENCQLNGIPNMKIKQGDASALQTQGTFDVIVANINKNILLEDLKYYVKHLKHKGLLIMSGFYANDLPDIDAEAVKHHLTLKTTKENNQWVAVTYELF
ncbi:50S ribosomal protein L11 methyltransferase [Geofilum rubicundum]|uniref:Ribosomal protein L11 methyltransferase n=1 Tax=Geofilum rubicundum JCM 15548 TaxID=1236989 RepID=A0A0E9M1Q7_9BACT|nr:50S ribosomal protein L11 methyltransferase [Geofilum rubicundum]GAO31414.1 ribosomal protein L11 methyltransferase [Geofilum rubicundum JCM 15548]